MIKNFKWNLNQFIPVSLGPHWECLLNLSIYSFTVYYKFNNIN